ncbi:MAG: metallophosphoesterase [Clostridia bacterium]|nr:metallophosphoesterase [Clostridia bacterium]
MQRKRKWTKILCGVLAVSVLAVGGFSACKKKIGIADLVDFTVSVESGRDMRVLHISDPQLTDVENAENYCYRYVRQVVERYDPDLILVTGDLVYGQFDDDGTIFVDYVEFMETLDTPWAPVFGNHDNESEMGADWQCRQLENAENCLFKQRELSGNGNYSVGLVQDGKLKRAFFMLDSNGCGGMSAATRENGHSTTSVGLMDDQRAWYTGAMQRIKGYSAETKLSMAFHIQPFFFRWAIGKYIPSLAFYGLDLDTFAQTESGDFGYIGKEMKGAWGNRDNIYLEVKDLGVDSIFVGHEHLNSFSIVHDGMRMQYGQKCSQYDRYNKWVDGAIVGDYSHVGTPIMGGTMLPVSQADGNFVTENMGLLLYDEAWGV